MRKQVRNQKGSSLIGALFIVLAMGVAGAGVMQLSASETGSSADQVLSTQAFYAGQAGIEQIKRQLDFGMSPAGTLTIGSGTATITTNPFQRLGTVVAQVGDAQITQTINTDFSRDAIQFDTSAAAAVGNSVNDTRAIKIRLQSVTLTAMRIEWNQDPCVLSDTYTPENNLAWCNQDDGGSLVTDITMEGTQLYGSSIGGPSGGAESGERIDLMDYSFVANQAYSFDFTLTNAVPSGTLITVTFEFLDGSELETTYQVFGACDLQYFAKNNGRLDVNQEHQIHFEVLARNQTFGSGGNALDVRMMLGRVGPNGGISSWNNMFGGNYVLGGETDSATDTGPASYVLKARGTRGNNFTGMYDSTNTLQVITVMNGDLGPKLAGYSGNNIHNHKLLANYFDINSRAILEPNQVLMLFELSNKMKSGQNTASHYQDVVVLITVDSTDPACAP